MVAHFRVDDLTIICFVIHTTWLESFDKFHSSFIFEMKRTFGALVTFLLFVVGHCYLQYRIVEQHGLVWDRREHYLPLDKACLNQSLITDTTLKLKSQLARALFSYGGSHSSYLQSLPSSVFGEGYIHPTDFRGKHDFTLLHPGPWRV